MDAAERLRQVRAAAGLVATSAPGRVESYSNDAWLLDDARLGAVVLRVGWRGDITRLDREAAVLKHAPDRVRRPEVVGHGRLVVDGISLSYTLTRRIPGQPLAEVWTCLTGAQRRSTVGQVAEALSPLHRWRPPRGSPKRSWPGQPTIATRSVASPVPTSCRCRLPVPSRSPGTLSACLMWTQA